MFENDMVYVLMIEKININEIIRKLFLKLHLKHVLSYTLNQIFNERTKTVKF